MELMQLEMFVAMVEEGSFQRAAARVFRTQPAVSMALRRLEQELGAPLFDRSNRSDYALTNLGQVLYEHARRMINLRDETVVALQDLHSLQSGRLKIGANESTSLYLLPGLILRFREQCPKIKIEVFRHVSNRLPYELRQRNLDVAILSYLPEDADLESSLVMRDELVLIVSPEHRLAGQARVHVKDLGGEVFIAHNTQSPSRKRVIEAFRRFQTPLNITIEIATIETVKKFVGMNLGIGFVPLMCVQEEVGRGTLSAVGVEGLRCERSLWVVRRKTDAHSHAAQAFLQVVGPQSEMMKMGSSYLDVARSASIPARSLKAG